PSDSVSEIQACILLTLRRSMLRQVGLPQAGRQQPAPVADASVSPTVPRSETQPLLIRDGSDDVFRAQAFLKGVEAFANSNDIGQFHGLRARPANTDDHVAGPTPDQPAEP